ncbi:hypothetical protein RRG08_006355 [Elysia crispata]|uniref:Uncharacterized protein n=1 Tax=Elysia crispata TaxID=231223 RepID=A0AAE0Z9Q6_9GAST|nr:hypothetical protein RRG08_006355 [Elysia crispata]
MIQQRSLPNKKSAGRTTPRYNSGYGLGARPDHSHYSLSVSRSSEGSIGSARSITKHITVKQSGSGVGHIAHWFTPPEPTPYTSALL